MTAEWAHPTSPLTRSVEAWAREHWPQIAAMSWRSYLAVGRGLLIVSRPEDPAHARIGYAPEGGLPTLATDIAAHVGPMVAAYNPGAEVALLAACRRPRGATVFVPLRVEADPPPPIAARAH